jgi:diguanylate cyclase (GGDEF)-like protein
MNLEDRTRWRALGALFVTAGPLAAVTLALPHAPDGNDLVVLALATIATVAGVLQIVFARWLPGGSGALGALLLTGTLMITAALIATQDATSPLALLYVWAGVEAFFFLQDRVAVWFLACIAACYAIALAFVPAPPHDDAVARWLLTVSAVIVTSVMAAALRARSDRLVRELAEAARRDALTGLLNRRGFNDAMSLELERARRGDRQLAVLVADLDHFKSVNDNFGHGAGDDALRAFAALCVATVRKVDTVARIGGEEFALLLPDTDEAGGLLAAERVRRAVRDAQPISVSFGVAVFPGHGETGERLLHAADQALYAAKAAGRDRSEIAPVLDEAA